MKLVLIPTEGESQYGVWFALKDVTGEIKATTDQKKKSSASKFKSWIKDSMSSDPFGSDGNALLVSIKMRESDYHQYFATNEETGDYLENVKEPPGGRLAWVRQRFEEQDPMPEKVKDIGRYAMKINTLGSSGGMVPSYATSGGHGAGVS